MGYTTDFKGQFLLNVDLDDKTEEFLKKLATTRRMMRDVSKLPKSGFEKYGFDSWGTDGEFYVDGAGYYGQDQDKSILDYNFPPRTQPGLWCQWEYDQASIQWNGGEKFYHYIEWLEYIIEKVLEPRGYKLNGMVEWQGEESDDFGQLKVEDNKMFSRVGKMGYGDWQ